MIPVLVKLAPHVLAAYQYQKETQMNVKCLPSHIKDQICLAYNNKTLTLKELANHFSTSRRTIGRVLEERGLATPVPRLKGEAHQVMLLIKSYGLDIDTLTTLLKTVSMSTPLKPEVQDIMKLLRAHDLDIVGLTAKLSSTPLTPINVQLFLNQCTKDQLAQFFYTSGLIKLAEIAQQAHANQQQATQPREQHAI